MEFKASWVPGRTFLKHSQHFCHTVFNGEICISASFGHLFELLWDLFHEPKPSFRMNIPQGLGFIQKSLGWKCRVRSEKINRWHFWVAGGPNSPMEKLTTSGPTLPYQSENFFRKQNVFSSFGTTLFEKFFFEKIFPLKFVLLQERGKSHSG